MATYKVKYSGEYTLCDDDCDKPYKYAGELHDYILTHNPAMDHGVLTVVKVEDPEFVIRFRPKELHRIVIRAKDAQAAVAWFKGAYGSASRVLEEVYPLADEDAL